jgi:cellulase/cellobiase CelA1
VTSAWKTGGNGELRITNDNSSALSSWTVRITRDGHTLSLWSAEDSSTGNAFVTASNQSHNARVAAGATTAVSGGAVGGAPVTEGTTLACKVTDAS